VLVSANYSQSKRTCGGGGCKLSQRHQLPALLGARMVAEALPDYGLTGLARREGPGGAPGAAKWGAATTSTPAGRLGPCVCACIISHRIIVRLSSRLRSVAPRRLRSASARCFLPWSHRRPGRRHAHSCLLPVSVPVPVCWMDDGFHFCTPIEHPWMERIATIQGG